MPGDLDALPQPTVAAQLGADEGVQALAAMVVACDENSLAPGARGLALAPYSDRRLFARAGSLRVAGDDGAARAVLNRAQTVVTTRDDPITDAELSKPI